MDGWKIECMVVATVGEQTMAMTMTLMALTLAFALTAATNGASAKTKIQQHETNESNEQCTTWHLQEGARSGTNAHSYVPTYICLYARSDDDEFLCLERTMLAAISWNGLK